MAEAMRLDAWDERPVAADPEQSFTLSGRHYSDPAVFGAEKERIFYRSWQYAGHVADLEQPGDYITVSIVDQPVAVVRGRDGVLRGFHNVCRHRAHELLRGRGNLKAVITCPYHAWAYGLDGALRSARNCKNVKGFDKADFSLSPVRVDVALGMVFVNLDPDAVSLAEQAGDMFTDILADLPGVESLRPWRDPAAAAAGGEVRRGGMAFNWKVLCDNCLECYHCEPAHPAFCDLIDMDSYRTTLHGHWSVAKSRLLRGDNAAYPVDEGAPNKLGNFWFLWPNISFGCMPGQASLGVFVIDPVDAETTQTRGDILTVPGQAPDPRRSAYGRGVLWPEDQGICEAVHRGLKSRGYHQGRFIVDEGRSEISEHGVHHFQRLYAQAMGLV
ncbi:MAG: aromatic ring-hydroxylating dioxygenase subunit alpha [Proteobacteria bacterium]|nr:aromatic ring-hydroxylating dioxygenase subunit alpha [Pseudomonadota bacterium]MDA1070564.1 aromatic ring-hydroxylating dioxygenase subunit alpha [Pseudomonadota bacterium]